MLVVKVVGMPLRAATCSRNASYAQEPTFEGNFYWSRRKLRICKTSGQSANYQQCPTIPNIRIMIEANRKGKIVETISASDRGPIQQTVPKLIVVPVATQAEADLDLKTCSPSRGSSVRQARQTSVDDDVCRAIGLSLNVN